MEAHLSGRHRDTVEKIFSQPPNRKTEVFPAPHGKDVEVQIVVDLRRILNQAGFAPDGSAGVADQGARDHGDGQWGEPT
jgi:hypothetical protein